MDSSPLYLLTLCVHEKAMLITALAILDFTYKGGTA